MSGRRWGLRKLGRLLSAPAPSYGSPGRRPELLQPLSSAAREAIDAAQEEARMLGHQTVGTEHLLLALTRNTASGACNVMERMGTAPAEVRAEILDAMVVGPAVAGPAQASDRLTFTPRARLAVELSYRAAIRIGASHTGTEHLLIGLATEREGIAARALRKSGIGARSLENQVVLDLDGEA